MSVLTPIVESFDGAARRIYLKAGVTDYFPIEDIYHEYRSARKNDEELRKFDGLIEAAGNVPKGGGAFTPRYVVLLDGTKVVPFNDSLQINQLGEIITDNPDVDASIYDISSLTVAKPIFIKPSESEIIQLTNEPIVFTQNTLDSIGQAVMEAQVPAVPTAGSFGEFLKDKLLTVFKFNVFK